MVFLHWRNKSKSKKSEVGRIDERNLHEPDKKDCYLSSRNL